jgi:hypothetical protein
MIAKRVFFRLVMLTLSFAALRAVAVPTQSQFCRDVAVLCSTNTSWGECGYEYGQDCQTCYGDDGSIQPNSPDCF